MRRIKPAAAIGKVAIAETICALRAARTLLHRARADRACKAAARALESAEGARRHVHHPSTRTIR